MRRNQDLRDYAIERGVLLWRVAEKLCIADSSLSRLLRYPLTEKERKRIISAIDEVEKEGEELLEE